MKALSIEGQIITRPADAIKDPVIPEFLGLEERTHWQERDLEQAIIDRLELFLLELGKGFCFVAQHRAEQLSKAPSPNTSTRKKKLAAKKISS